MIFARIEATEDSVTAQWNVTSVPHPPLQYFEVSLLAENVTVARITLYVLHNQSTYEHQFVNLSSDTTYFINVRGLDNVTYGPSIERKLLTAGKHVYTDALETVDYFMDLRDLFYLSSFFTKTR